MSIRNIAIGILTIASFGLTSVAAQPGLSSSRKPGETDQMFALRTNPECSKSTDMRVQVEKTKPVALAVSRVMSKAQRGTEQCRVMAKSYLSQLNQAENYISLAFQGNSVFQPAPTMISMACTTYRMVLGNLTAAGCDR
jgi:hypothetical protein